MADDLARFLSLYVRPRRAFAGIIDDGSLLFAFLAAALASVLLGAGPVARAMAVTPAGYPAGVQQGEGAVDVPDGDEATGEEAARSGPAAAVPRHPRAWAAAALSASAGIWAVAGLALVHAPFVLLMATLVAPIGSFGVAFRRDFGPLLACLLNAWAAAFLPVAAAAAFAPLPLVFGLWTLGALGFTVLTAFAVRTALGVRPGAAAVVAGLGWLAFVLQPCLGFLASPFLLFLGFHYLRGDIGDVLWSFRSRQSFRRYLQAATLNPRDADAHYQLGLIHQQRGQREEAAERFRRAVEIDPGELDAHYQLGRMAREDRRFEDALRHFEAVLARDDAFARHEAWREVGATYLEHGSLAEARWALEKYVERRPHDPEGLFRLGAAAAKLGDVERARDALARCLEAVETTPRYRRREVATWARQARQQLGQLGAK